MLSLNVGAFSHSKAQEYSIFSLAYDTLLLQRRLLRCRGPTTLYPVHSPHQPSFLGPWPHVTPKSLLILAQQRRRNVAGRGRAVGRSFTHLLDRILPRARCSRRRHRTFEVMNG